jgi:branched-chain amino acid transport system ATP-binding protein
LLAAGRRLVPTEAGGRLTIVTPVLEATGVHAAYGRLPVLFDIDLTVEPGTVLAVLGANGAGKTTLLSVLAGLLPAEQGTIRFCGDDVTDEPAERRIRRGLALVQGGAAVFPALTVAENLRAGCFSVDRGDRDADNRRDAALALFPVLRDRMAQRAGTLSGGERQMLALAKGLLLGGHLLCIDELSLGLAPLVVEQLGDVVQRLREQGRTMIIVEQSVSLALRLADQVVVLERGRVVLRGTTDELASELHSIEAALLGGAA